MSVVGSVGRSSSFEVVVEDGATRYLAWSKLAKGTFPDFSELGRQVAAYASSHAVPATWAKLA